MRLCIVRHGKHFSPSTSRCPDRSSTRAARCAPAIFKEPVSRVSGRPTEPRWDRQADLRVHGGPDKAVYAYDLSGYEHWRRSSRRELPFGQFGENLTVEGMPETEVRIDDVYRVGRRAAPGLAAALALLQARS